MSYMALYRKWRPRDFDGVVGQDPIVTALKNQIQYQRIGHAYLFCGTRGTGKTSTAKIFARAVNCLNPRDGNPCNECELCQEAETGFNVVEIDAASNNGVDNIREIREEVKYTPAKGRYKVYIIDEVHMLSAGAFNALLKTLEEPQSTLSSFWRRRNPIRFCRRSFHGVSAMTFAALRRRRLPKQLQTLTEKEGLEADEDALQYIARMADGAMRDALSILDQCSSFYLGQRITLEKVYDVLGAVDTQIFYEATRALAGADAMACLQCVDEIFSKGRDPSQFLTDWISHLRDALMTKALGAAGVELLEISADRAKGLTEQAQSLSADQLTYFITQLSKLEQSDQIFIPEEILIEVGLLRLCHPEDDHTDEALRSRLDAVEQRLAGGLPLNSAQAPPLPQSQNRRGRRRQNSR
ncbi:MAG: DNA polymerase III subunit gamma/tau [Clostridia bacterium]